MALNKLRVAGVALAGVCLLAACGGDDETDSTPDETVTVRDSGSKDSGKGIKSDAGSVPDDGDDNDDTVGDQNGEDKSDGGLPPGANDAGDETPTVITGKCDYEDEEVKLTKDLVVPAGKTVHVCPGTKFIASTDVKIDVLGALVVDGSADKPVSFVGTADAVRSWHGLVLEQGGSLKLTHGKVSGAIYGLFANPGSTFAVDRSEFSVSFKAAVLQAEGTFNNTKVIATAPPGFAITDAVTVDDPNGTVTVMDASPSFSNVDFDGNNQPVTDVVRVGGKSSSTFDHVSVRSAHCGFHTSGGTNTSIHVTNSVFTGLSYGIMAYATKPIIEDSVFTSTGSDVGICTGATTDNTPVLKNNSYESGKPKIDASCFRINTTDPSPAAAANPSAGPSGL